MLGDRWDNNHTAAEERATLRPTLSSPTTSANGVDAHTGPSLDMDRAAERALDNVVGSSSQCSTRLSHSADTIRTASRAALGEDQEVRREDSTNSAKRLSVGTDSDAAVSCAVQPIRRARSR